MRYKMKAVVLFVMGLLCLSPAFGSGAALPPESAEKEETSQKPHVYIFQATTVGDDAAFVTPHYLGEPCTAKWGAFQSGYTRTYAQDIGFSSTTVEFAKPSVYHAVKKVNRYVVKAVKKKRMKKADAVTLMCHVLDCANAILYENDTRALEKDLASTKEPERLIDIFNHIELIANTNNQSVSL